ncbi:helix-turn-helix transcriptional regulator [Bradyrhizobium sp. SZCCHNPS2010]|uniref:helix-turn-helix domain-containing protein n=1 Tax=Bradyrhizobium sp. SZCCHNPS2010 TaxID=3057333 RepID=UPI002915DAD2|nr:helix-turn-helix transcriptional regulator [Bradyrhizobium sp. SZCCHNPS2010]
MKNDMTVKRSSGNIFADIGLPNAENHLVKAQIVVAVGNLIRSQNLTQAAAAEKMGLKQPDVSKLLDGRFEGFSLERLIGFLLALGNDVTIEFGPSNDNNAPTGKGHLKLAHA